MLSTFLWIVTREVWEAIVIPCLRFLGMGGGWGGAGILCNMY